MELFFQNGFTGDPWEEPRPRQNENGGTYGQGLIVKNYEVGQVSCPLIINWGRTNESLGQSRSSRFQFSLQPIIGDPSSGICAS